MHVDGVDHGSVIGQECSQRTPDHFTPINDCNLFTIELIPIRYVRVIDSKVLQNLLIVVRKRQLITKEKDLTKDMKKSTQASLLIFQVACKERWT